MAAWSIKYRWVALVVQCGLGIALLWWILQSAGLGGEQLMRRVVHASVPLLALGVASFLGTMGLSALRYRALMPAAIPFRYLMGTTLLQNALLTFVPWRIGEVGYPLILRRDYNVPIVSSGAIVLAVRIVDLLIVLAVALAGAVRLGLVAAGPALGAGTLLFAASVIGITLAIKYRYVPGGLATRSALRPLLEARRLGVFLALSIAGFAMSTLQGVFIFNALGFPILPPDMAILNALTLLTALLPIHAPGGWGTIDAIQIVILGRFGHDAGVIVASILAVHALYTVLIMAGGTLGWFLRGASRPAVAGG